MNNPLPPQAEIHWIKHHLPKSLAGHSPKEQTIRAVLALSLEGNTIPFIARYRKEQTGNADEVAIAGILDAKERYDQLVERKTFISKEIEKQGKLSEALLKEIQAVEDVSLLEDIYAPFKIKRRTKAAMAKDAGLEGLAQWIWDVGHGVITPEPGQTLEIWAFTFRNTEKGYDTAESCIQGAQDILVERISDQASLRSATRIALFENGYLKTTKGPKAKAPSKFEPYFAYQEPIKNLLKKQNTYRYLAIRRGWIEEELKMTLGGAGDEGIFEKTLEGVFEQFAVPNPQTPVADILRKASKLAYKAHVLPSIEAEVHKALREIADETAIEVFIENLRKILLSAPLGPKAVLGVDPGIRTGCKLAAVNAEGQFIGDSVLYLQTEEQKAKSKELLKVLFSTGSISAVAVGNGTNGRETYAFIRDLIKESQLQIPVVLVSESGASVYSASEVAREEFANLDLTVRGAISIARRLQDPLSEWVKVDPKSIGVGQYQHDVSPHALKRALDRAVESCVNRVGVKVNTASKHLLKHVAGIGDNLAASIVEYRATHGLFQSRASLKNVPRLSDKVFQQAAGFLRVPESALPFDNTGVHPEHYEILEALIQKFNIKASNILGDEGVAWFKSHQEAKNFLIDKLGELTASDILLELAKPGLDPRDGFDPPQFRSDLSKISDLKVGMECPGVVTNVTQFGAFVDIGVHQDGLVHISQLSNQFVKDPQLVVGPGQKVKVKILEVNLEKNQIALTMRTQSTHVAAAPQPEQKPVKATTAPRPQVSPQPKRNPVVTPTYSRPKSPNALAKSNGPVIAPVSKNVPHAVTAKRTQDEFKNNPFAALKKLKTEG